MPIYEYQCQSCGHEFSQLQKVSSEPVRDCPACDQDQVSRLVSAAGFKLKGTGWYETDFKNTGQKAAKQETPKKDNTAKQTETKKNESNTTTSGEKVNT